MSAGEHQHVNAAGKEELGKKMGRASYAGKEAGDGWTPISAVGGQNWAKSCTGHQVVVEHEDDIRGPG